MSTIKKAAVGLLAAAVLVTGIVVDVRTSHSGGHAADRSTVSQASGAHQATTPTTAARPACGLTLPPPESPEPQGAVQTSASINPTSPTDFASCAFRQSVLNLRDEGADEVTLIVPYAQASFTTSAIDAEAITPTRASLVSAVHFARTLGMRVMLSFHDDMANGDWRADIDASDRVTWFARYGAILDYLGGVAQASGAAEICIGTEMSDMASNLVNPANGPAWLQMIANLKKVYTGELTYGGQRPGAYSSETDSLSFWPEMSQIGIDAYYPLGDTCDPSVASMIADWHQIDEEYLQPLVHEYGKPILFTELGFSSVECDNLDPAYYGGGGGYYAGDGHYDGTAQAQLFEALFRYFSTDSDFAGISVWFWYSNPELSYPGDLSFSTYRKPAGSVLDAWFHRLDTLGPRTA